MQYADGQGVRRRQIVGHRRRCPRAGQRPKHAVGVKKPSAYRLIGRRLPSAYELAVGVRILLTALPTAPKRAPSVQSTPTALPSAYPSTWLRLDGPGGATWHVLGGPGGAIRRRHCRRHSHRRGSVWEVLERLYADGIAVGVLLSSIFSPDSPAGYF